MRHGTAVRRLRTIAERCHRVAGPWDDEDEPIPLAAYAFGAVLDGNTDIPVVQVALVLNLPADELTWCARPQSCSGLAHLLELEKAPVDWYWRPAVWPVSNHVIRRPLRIWSTDGVEGAALDALAGGVAEPLRLPAPQPEHGQEQLAVELAACLAHLRRVEDAYWQREWRQDNRGSGIYPEHHLWDAVHGYLDLHAAVSAPAQPADPRPTPDPGFA